MCTYVKLTSLVTGAAAVKFLNNMYIVANKEYDSQYEYQDRFDNA